MESLDDYILAKLTHSVHRSQRLSWRGCRRRADWIFNHFYYPHTTAKPLEFGIAYHVGLQTYFDPMFWNKPRDVVLEMAIQAFRRECQKQWDKYDKVQPEGYDSDEVRKDYLERKKLGEGMLRYFHEKVRDAKELEHMRPLMVEATFEIPIKNPETDEQLWCRCQTCWTRFLLYVKEHPGDYMSTGLAINDASQPDGTYWKGLPVTYGGRIDAVMQNVVTGKVWIVDWKTAKQLGTESVRAMLLELDDQILSYCAAMWVLGADIAGFLYFEQKKAVPEPPEPLVRPRLGRMFSISKQNTYDPEVYVATIKELDTEAYEAGLYDDYIEYLKVEGGRFYGVYPEYRTVAQMEHALQNIYDEAVEMLNPATKNYPNAGRFNCQNCAFQIPCIEKSAGRDYEYLLETQFDKRTYHYWEDTPANTDKPRAGT